MRYEEIVSTAVAAHFIQKTEGGHRGLPRGDEGEMRPAAAQSDSYRNAYFEHRDMSALAARLLARSGRPLSGLPVELREAVGLGEGGVGRSKMACQSDGQRSSSSCGGDA